jgi:hypothetical protein
MNAILESDLRIDVVRRGNSFHHDFLSNCVGRFQEQQEETCSKRCQKSQSKFRASQATSMFHYSHPLVEHLFSLPSPARQVQINATSYPHPSSYAEDKEFVWEYVFNVLKSCGVGVGIFRGAFS